MAVCLVCSAEWVEQSQACGQCGTPFQDLERMRAKAGSVRFLFGEATPTTPPKSEGPPSAPPRPPRRASKPPVKSAPPKAKRPDPMNTDIILDRDVQLQRSPEKPPGRLANRLGAYGLDVLICLILDYWVLRLILVVSPRPLNDLLTFSLIPVLFVLLTFTFLYYWLFFSIFGQTLGGLILDKLKRRTE